MDEAELVKSPLQQLELQTARSRSADSPTTNPTTNGDSASYVNPDPVISPTINNLNDKFERDRGSVYSFDSVSTTGRLLDRLGLEGDDFLDEDLDPQFDSHVNVQDVSSSLPFSSNNGPGQLQSPFVRQNSQSGTSIQTNSSRSLERMPSSKAQSMLSSKPSLRKSSQDSRFVVKNAPVQVALTRRNNSVDSLQADINSINSFNSVGSVVTPQRRHTTRPSEKKKTITPERFNTISHGKSTNPDPSLNEYDEFDFNSSNDSLETFLHSTLQQLQDHHKPLHKSNSKSNSNSNSNSPSSFGSPIQSPNGPQRAPSAPLTRNLSLSSNSPVSPKPRRTVSDFASSPNGKAADLSPESRTRLSNQLRSAGKHREASYQLQIAANGPNNYPKAMYLYAMALKYGQGVKQNDSHSLKWLCKAIILYNNDVSDSFITRLNELRLDDLLKLTISYINNDTNEKDPIKLYDYYAKIPLNQLNKFINSIKNNQDIKPLVYHELGNTFIHGWGVSQKDELHGMECLAIASSAGNCNSMVQLGELWCTKSKSRKKDNYKASAWLRLAEVFGHKSIGNSWIYKDKYLSKK